MVNNDVSPVRYRLSDWARGTMPTQTTSNERYILYDDPGVVRLAASLAEQKNHGSGPRGNALVGMVASQLQTRASMRSHASMGDFISTNEGNLRKPTAEKPGGMDLPNRLYGALFAKRLAPFTDDERRVLSQFGSNRTNLALNLRTRNGPTRPRDALSGIAVVAVVFFALVAIALMVSLVTK